ncbi:MAG: flagellar basal body rod protein FlgC [Ruminobacter sp.]|nr:flagellar basal body rod protein FlgC [Ruminobacter sp.]
MSLFGIMDIAGSAMSAQSLRLNTTASNLANADSVSSSADTTYKARRPVFAAMYEDALGMNSEVGSAKVSVEEVVESELDSIKEYMPNHPLADSDGYIYRPNVNPVEEMADMVSASRSYQTSVQVAESAKQMLLSTLRLGKA